MERMRRLLKSESGNAILASVVAGGLLLAGVVLTQKIALQTIYANNSSAQKVTGASEDLLVLDLVASQFAFKRNSSFVVFRRGSQRKRQNPLGTVDCAVLPSASHF